MNWIKYGINVGYNEVWLKSFTSVFYPEGSKFYNMTYGFRYHLTTPEANIWAKEGVQKAWQWRTE
jgi:hypothetical protein